MAQKPVADALTLELEPVVEADMTPPPRHRGIWFAHDPVPFDQGRTAFTRRTRWDPSQSTLPRTITDASEILLILQRTTWPVITVSSVGTSYSRWWGAGSAGGPQRSTLHCTARILVVTGSRPVANEDDQVNT